MTLKRFSKLTFLISFVLALSLIGLKHVSAQETDITQAPNTANAGIQKSFDQQIGERRGDENTVKSLLYIIKRGQINVSLNDNAHKQRP